MTKPPIPTSEQLELFHEDSRRHVKEQLDKLKELTANDVQVAGTHYKSKAIQPWDYIVGNDLGYLEGNIIKYVCRWRGKNGMADLEKAKHYIELLMALEGGDADTGKES